MGLAMARFALALAAAIMLCFAPVGSTETVLERMRREKAKYEAQAGTAAGKKEWQARHGLANSDLLADDLLTVIKTGDVAKVSRKLEQIGTKPIDDVDRMQNGVLHYAAKILNNTAAKSIGSMLVQKKPPMNVRSAAPRQTICR